MFHVFLKKIAYHKRNYLLKGLLLFLLFTSINVIGIFAIQLTGLSYRYSSNYQDDVYYSGKFTNPDNNLIYDIRDTILYKDYCFTYDVKDEINGSTIRYTGYYEGNFLAYGFINGRIYNAVDSSVLIQEDNLHTVVVSSNIEENEITADGNTYAVSYKATFSVPYFFESQYKTLGYDKIEYVFVKKMYDETTDPEITSIILHSDDATVHNLGLRHTFSLGKDLNNEASVAIGSISLLFYFVFSLPYIFILILWSSLIKMTDTVSTKELEVFRSFGYTKKQASHMFFLENVFLSIPGVLLSSAIFIPIIMSFNYSFIIPLFLTGFALLYYLLFCLFYTKSVIKKIYQTTKL